MRKIFLPALMLFLVGCCYYYLSAKPLYIDRVSEKYVKIRTEQRSVAFEHVNVVPMNGEYILNDQTVIVEQGIIAAIGNTECVKIPDGAMVIDGRGKYLLPGLADMHTHLIFSKNDLLLYLANGVTTVRNMAGYRSAGLFSAFFVKDHVKIKEQIAKGKLLGPNLYTASPILESKTSKTFVRPLYTKADTVRQAEDAVRQAKDDGYDFIKVYNKIPLDAFEATVNLAQSLRLQVIGHIPHNTGLKRILQNKQLHTIEHLTGYINPFASFKIPESEIGFYARLSKDSGVWNCPTMVVWQNIVASEKVADIQGQPNMQYVSPAAKKAWKSNIKMFNKMVAEKVDGFETLPSHHISDYIRMTEELHKAGANLILGTDAGTLNVLPGFSIHEELKNLINAGLTPYEAIRTGTYNAALCMDKLDEFGTIEAGKRADLLLLNANPLEDVANVSKRTGVMINGLWLTEVELNHLITELATFY